MKNIRLLVITNYFVLSLLICYFVWLFSRIVLEKLPQNSITLLSVFVVFGISNKIFHLGLAWHANKIANRKKKESFLKQYANRLKDIAQKVEDYFQINFIRLFLSKKPFFVKFSFGLVKLFEITEKRKLTEMIFLCILLFPWFIFLFGFFFEVFLNKPFLITLYLLSFSFLIRRLFTFFSLLLKNYLDFLSIVPITIYLKPFSKTIETRSFFVSNPMIRNLFYFSKPEIQNKRTLIFCWQLFGEIIFFSKLNKTLEVILLNLEKQQSLLFNINLIFFSSVLLAKILDCYFILSDLFYVSLIFLVVFFIFLVFLNFLIKEIETKNKFYQVKDLDNFFEKNLLETKNKLLTKYLFLKDSDLKDFFDSKTINVHCFEFFELENNRFLNSSLNPDDLLIFQNVCEDLFSWFQNQADLGMINFDNFTYNYDKFHEIYGKKL